MKLQNFFLIRKFGGHKAAVQARSGGGGGGDKAGHFGRKKSWNFRISGNS